MKLRTSVRFPDYTFNIRHQDAIFAIGSCFSMSMSSKLDQLGYQVITNPCGITFNPASLLTTVKRIKAPNSLHESQLYFHNELYAHPDFHSSFNDISAQSFLESARHSLQLGHNALTTAKVVFITIGTCFVFRDKNTSSIVNNCHKLPADRFTRALLTLPQVTAILSELRTAILDISETAPKLVWTVSPVRHSKNGLVEDKKSKATALLAVHHMVDTFEDSHYFPSYELLIDDLRDYRFYNEDLIHPTLQAENYIFSHLTKQLLAAEDETLRKKIKSIRQRQQHRPFNPDSTTHKTFLKKLEADIEELILGYPHLKDFLGH